MARYNPRDKFYRKARAEGLPSRAAFKIEELIARFKLVRPGARVADLGCAPGWWLAILTRAVGPNGRVVGIDLDQCAAPGPNVVTIAGDIRDALTRAQVASLLADAPDRATKSAHPVAAAPLGAAALRTDRFAAPSARFAAVAPPAQVPAPSAAVSAPRVEDAALYGAVADLITSDLSPKLTGIADRDQARSAELLTIALEFAADVLKPGGAMIAKLFMGGGFEDLKRKFDRAFDKVEIAHTRASRPGSSELYLVARGFRPGAAAAQG
jgi:23S rRNA (uridine2552-2'-O)-methyltransferase